MSTTTVEATGLDSLKAEYDHLREVRDDLRRVLTRDERLNAIAEAVRAGEPAPDLWENSNSRDLQLAGVARALEQVTAEVVAEVGKGYDVRLKRTIDPTYIPTSDQLVATVEEAFDATIVAQQTVEEKRLLEDAYDRATEKVNKQKLAHAKSGGSAESFRPNLSEEEWRALNPVGNLGGRRV
jgi:hypothetical protein